MRYKSIATFFCLKTVLLFAVILLGTGASRANVSRKTFPLLPPVTSADQYETTHSWDHGREIIQWSKSRFNQKRPAIRRKAQRLIEGDDKYAPVAKTICYSHAAVPNLAGSYEAPFFLSEQHSFLYRLAIF
ncbi:hypothetical protein C7T94_04275 [Pedobacter yulinensis]|uniref:Uncharacterized protein n=1 Tax=Pedobacter yulinensis TaxID=2126353 RepID=A0A2T3HNE4_9SPHI|nr:hypothetical protein [Pedobacter yulinensis]PST83964.1 hypothetical protein C7T94_04275 [Pedobacter yulinensis]